MPVSKYYKPLSGSVRVPGEEDPVEIGRQGNTTSMVFGFGPDANIEAAQQYGRAMGSRRPVTQSEISEDALMRSQLGVPDIPLDLLQFGRGVPQMPAPLVGKPAKPAESYGTNRGGTGSAGRGQLGKSQFDVQTYAQPEMSIADLRKMDDKPWELDDNTAADVTPGLSFTQKPEENIVDKEPDLQSPRGMYEALAKKYPDILTQNLDQLQKSRVTEDDLEGLSDRSGLGSLFIAASKAASGAGSIGGKTAESIAPTIVNREDTLARQRLKDRMDVASENMQMNAKAVDLAIKQINFADEREQYDPNSDVSQFARDFMKQEFDVNVPANVPAYQLKQFMPAVVQKYQAKERAQYERALLGYKETPAQQAARRATESEAERKFKAEQARLDRQSREGIAGDRLKKPGAVKETPREKLQMKLVEKDAEVYQKRLQGLQKLDGGLKSLDDATTAEQIVQIGQSMLKTINDPENSDAVGVDEAKRLADELQSWSILGPGGLLRIGRDLPGFKQRVKLLRDRLYNTANTQYKTINQKTPDLVDPPPTYDATTGAAPKGRSVEEIDAEIARIKAEKARRKGGQ
jgi:hypothetical protein